MQYGEEYSFKYGILILSLICHEIEKVHLFSGLTFVAGLL